MAKKQTWQAIVFEAASGYELEKSLKSFFEDNDDVNVEHVCQVELQTKIITTLFVTFKNKANETPGHIDY